MSKRKKSAKKAKQRAAGSAPAAAPAGSPAAGEAPSEAQRLFASGDYVAARAACGDDDEELKARLAVDPVFLHIYAGGLALIGVLAALTMR